MSSGDIYEGRVELCWFHFPIYTLKKKSQYVIAGSFLVLPTRPTNYFS